jgi:hypothetical protein
VHFDDHPNDEAMCEHGFQQGSAVYDAVGAKTVYRVPPYPSTHNLGTARMSARAEDGVATVSGKRTMFQFSLFPTAVSSRPAPPKTRR